jgi:hypothetical protein
MKENNVLHSNTKKVVELSLCLPGMAVPENANKKNSHFKLG